ncbi:MAG: glucosyltransferase domain-containing protein [Coriobacteriia bacterium]|nr:glucosyltransferase domain-containing protein [Coriobacteriia bacterium]MCL2536785.1 glucosyltransferase domain-containing protein [Coriobacteriia bacterium]
MQELIVKVKSFDLGAELINWWIGESPAAKHSFLAALIIGFVTNIFVYSSLIFGDHSIAMPRRTGHMVGAGRWIGEIAIQLSYSYLMPAIIGIFATVSLAAVAFLFCKIFDIREKISAFLIALIISTYPTVAIANVFQFTSANVHLGAALAVLAVYLAKKYKYGFLIGAVLLMIAIAIYQTLLNVALVLSVMLLVFTIVSERFNWKYLGNLSARLGLLIAGGGALYGISLPVSQFMTGITLTGYGGLSGDSMLSRMLSPRWLLDSFLSTSKYFFVNFDGARFQVVPSMHMAYILFLIIALILFMTVIINQRIYREPLRLSLLLLLTLLIPFASNFATFFTEPGFRFSALMGLAFMLPMAFVVAGADNRSNIWGIFKSLMLVCVLFIGANHVIVNNVYYLKAYYANQRIISFAGRLAVEIDRLIPEVSSEEKDIVYFGGIPNEHYPAIDDPFSSTLQGHPLANPHFLQMHNDGRWQQNQFVANLRNLHGVPVTLLSDDVKWVELRKSVLDSDMPAWPSEGGIAIIDDVIVINFGIEE